MVPLGGSTKEWTIGERAALDRELRLEQDNLDLLYARLEVVTDETAAALDAVRRSATVGTPGARSERDALATLHAGHLTQLRAVGDRLCFGRLDLTDGERRYVGRVGLSDEAGARLLIDWRAPAAEPFYRATAAEPAGVISRRHLTTVGRTVTAVSDEVLDLDAFSATHSDTSTVSDDGALMLALNARRTGRMHDIVATIQGEQDRVIREPLAGVLVVQGGPGTGKTAVALHRAAFLLYAQRERLARTGVLLVGPNERFLRYIDQVLPSLGETGVVMATPAQLLPGVQADGVEDDAVAEIKGRPWMAQVVAAAVRARQRVPRRPVQLDVDGVSIALNPDDVLRARGRARASHKPHNEARTTFVADLLATLVTRYAAKIGVALDDPGAPDARDELLAVLRESRDVRREVNLCWMPLTPERVIADLFADPDRLAAAAPRMKARDRALLQRDRGAAWTPADVPLLDEAAELLGLDDTATRRAEAQAQAERRQQIEFAQAVLEQGGTPEEGIAPGALLSAEELAERQLAPREQRSAAAQAGQDRTWAFGHVVVDEAQELSAMQWRLLMRRCPSKSMTLVGDTAQTGSAAGARTWGQMLAPHVQDRWRLRELTVNYRTPGQIMSVATRVLADAGVHTSEPVPARPGDWPPSVRRIAADDVEAIVASARDELELLPGGTVAVILARSVHARIGAAIEGKLADPQAAVLTPAQVKGLEFDAVVLVEPGRMITESPRGVNDLYVAMTRPTQRLTVLHWTEPPPALTD